MTQWAKNELTATKRQCGIEVYKDGAPCPRGTDLMATGFVYFRGANSPNAGAALGTMTNERVPLTFADKTVTAVDPATDQLTIVGHGLETGDGDVLLFGVGPGQPGGTTGVTPYYVIVVDANTFKIATSLANAYLGTAVDITDAGSGAILLKATATTQRGVDGRFVYQATQAETNHDNDESEVFVDSGSSGPYAFKNGDGGSAFVSMNSAVQGFETVIEGGHTGADILRLLTSILAGTVLDFSTGVLVFKSLDGTKTRLTVTTGPTGRLSIVVGDLT